jgi:ribosomal protein S13
MVHRHIRRQRAEVKDRLKRGSTSLSEVLQEAQADDVISGMRVSALLESLPGIGNAEARQIMTRLGIAESELVRELSARQRTALENGHGRPTGVADPELTQVEQAAAADVARIEQDDKYFGPEGRGIEDWDDP